jgi:hypothetical protein
MGRHPKSKAEKVAAGTYRKDRDKGLTVTLSDDTPEPPATLGERGRELWQMAYSHPWVTPGDKTIVQVVAEKLDERELVAEQFHLDPADFRHQRTLKEIDRDVLHGLDQLLLTPNARRRAGIEVETEEKPPGKVDLLRLLKDDAITREEYDRLMEPHRQADERELRRQAQRELLEDMEDASLRLSHALLDPDGARRRQQGYK